MIHLCYSDHRMTKSRQICSESALRNGADQSIALSTNDIPEFYQIIADSILKEERGAGYWVWKPIIIHEQLKKMNEGESLFYTDSGLEIVGNLKSIEGKEDIFLFSNGFIHQHWCKGDVLELYGLKGRQDIQCQASAIYIRKTKQSVGFIQEWLIACLNKSYIDDSPSTSANDRAFQEHRHDQALLTCLAIKYGIHLHWYPAKYIEAHNPKPLEGYPVLFHHHRRRNHEHL